MAARARRDEHALLHAESAAQWRGGMISAACGCMLVPKLDELPQVETDGDFAVCTAWMTAPWQLVVQAWRKKIVAELVHGALQLDEAA